MATKLVIEYQLGRQVEFLSLTLPKGIDVSASTFETFKGKNTVMKLLEVPHKYIHELSDEVKLTRLYRVVDSEPPSNRVPELHMLLNVVATYDKKGLLTEIDVIPSPLPSP